MQEEYCNYFIQSDFPSTTVTLEHITFHNQNIHTFSYNFPTQINSIFIHRIIQQTFIETLYGAHPYEIQLYFFGNIPKTIMLFLHNNIIILYYFFAMFVSCYLFVYDKQQEHKHMMEKFS